MQNMLPSKIDRYDASPEEIFSSDWKGNPLIAYIHTQNAPVSLKGIFF